MASIGDRLREAIGRRGLSLRAFQRLLEDECAKHGIGGASYAAFHNYVHDRREPPIGWLLLAAEVLDVRPEWLALGRGRPTAQEEQMERSESKPATDPIQRAIEHAVPQLAKWPPAVQFVFMSTLSTWIQAAPDASTLTPRQAAKLATDLHQFLTIPLQYWSFNQRMTEREFVEYADGLLTSLSRGMAAAGAGEALWVRDDIELYFGVKVPSPETLAREDERLAALKRAAKQGDQKASSKGNRPRTRKANAAGGRSKKGSSPAAKSRKE